MAATAQERNTPRRGAMLQRLPDLPVAAGVVIYAGTLVMLDADNQYVVPATEAEGRVVVGRANKTVDATSAAAGERTVEVEAGIYRWANLAGDALTAASRFQVAYAADNQSVGATGVGRSAVGRVLDVDELGVWVATNPLFPVA